ncbi:MAG: tetratricopeptide repeat protein [Leptolyngbya sp. SIO1E4]|nr:tetratricopeptide repeat protein [Leptolyngbya sp. SIO1E4]
MPNHQQQANALNLLGWTHFLQSNYRRAIDFAEQAIALYREISDRSGEARALNHLGSAYVSLDQYEQAIDIYQQSLAIVHELGDQQTEVFVLGNLGETYRNASQYELAIDFYEQSLAIAREINHTSGELNALANLGSTYLSIGQYQQAINLYEQSLALSRQVSARAKEGILLNNLGVVYRNLGEHRRAIGFYEQSLAIAREVGNRQGESNALHNLGGAYQSLGQNERAIDFYEQVLTITREIGDRAGEGNALGNLGLAYSKQGQDERAIDFYEQHLGIAREIGDRPGEGRTLANLGRLLAEKDQSELAIVFLKAAVEVRESIRSDIRGLDTDLRQSFTNTIADDYRFLADLLLGQGRIPEAQQVLDLLKLEELREFTDITRATWTGSKLQYTDPEQDVIDAHSSLIALGSDVIVCEETNCAELNSLYDRLSTLTAQYNQQVEQFQETIRRNRSEDEIFQDPDSLSGEAEKLLSAYAQNGQQTVLIYPFVLEDKLWIVWAATGNVIGSVEVPVSQGELATTVQRFGELLNSPNQLAELQVTSQQLYDWIIRPLETELTANNIDHLIFVNDRVTRYIPMAALYDGEQYLLERYTLSTVLAPGLTDTEDRLTNIDESEVLGLGLTQAVADFSPLPAVSEELDAIVRSDDADATGVYPGQVFLDDDFTLDTLKENVINHRVLHMATHAAFVPGQAEESFIMLGNGDPLKIADIEAMERRLRNLHMVVLSACQTALGGTAGDGTEIAGISSYFLEVGRAETVIASLWVVADTSTSLLMQRFYELLASGELTKAEALRQAQLSLLYDEDTETRLAAARTAIAVTARDGRPPTTTGFNHPYHWAPFILIGNGL